MERCTHCGKPNLTITRIGDIEHSCCTTCYPTCPERKNSKQIS